MKSISIGEAQGKLGQLIEAACRGELIVLTDGDKQVALEPNVNLDEDSPELEAELLKAADGTFTAYSSEKMRESCEQIIQKRRG